ncbi:MAG: hypothetical protein Q8S42_07755 [Archangium sp.]|nr:hypothetical protein [Archangium sp.]
MSERMARVVALRAASHHSGFGVCTRGRQRSGDHWGERGRVVDGRGAQSAELDDAARPRLRINVVLVEPWRLEEAVAALQRVLG